MRDTDFKLSTFIQVEDCKFTIILMVLSIFFHLFLLVGG